MSGLHFTGSKANWCHWFPIYGLHFSLPVGALTDRLIEFLEQMAYLSLEHIKVYCKIKKKYQIAVLPLWEFMFSLNRAETRPIPLLKLWKAFSQCYSRIITYVYIDPPRKFFFDLGKNGYHMNISLTCSLLKGRESFLPKISDLILIFLSFSHLVTHSTCSQSWMEKWELLILLCSCHYWVVCQGSVSGILRWHGNAPGY